MSGSLQDRPLKDDEPLRVPQSVPHPPQLFPERPDEAPTASRWHDCKVMPPRLQRRVISDAAVKVGVRVGVNPVSVDLPKALILQGWVVSRIVPLRPFDLLRCRRMVALSSPRCAACLCMWSGRLFPADLSPLRRLPTQSRLCCLLRLLTFILLSPLPLLVLPYRHFSLRFPRLVPSGLGRDVDTPPQTST